MEYWYHGPKMEINKKDTIRFDFGNDKNNFVCYKKLFQAMKQYSYFPTVCKIVPGKILADFGDSITTPQVKNVKGGYNIMSPFNLFCSWFCLQLINRRDFSSIIISAFKETKKIDCFFAITELYNLYDNTKNELDKASYGVLFYSLLFKQNMDYFCLTDITTDEKFEDKVIITEILEHIETTVKLLDDKTLTFDIVNNKLESLFESFML